MQWQRGVFIKNFKLVLTWINLICLLLSGLFSNIAAATSQSLWQNHTFTESNVKQNALRVKAQNALYLSIEPNQLALLQNQLQSSSRIQIPDINGTMFEFELTPAPILSTSLAAKYPSMMTYSGQQVGNSANFGRFSLSPKGLFGFYYLNGEKLLLSPLYTKPGTDYISYRYTDALPLNEQSSEALQQGIEPDFLLLEDRQYTNNLLQKSVPTGDQIRTYRLALSATGEYTQKLGGSKADVVEEIMTVVNRINQILLSDIAIQFELVDNQDVIFTDAANDPFSNNDAASDVASNQHTLDNLLGSANYDIGHLLSTNGGGLAAVASICSSGSKGTATSGSNSPQGERFYIDLLLHELGHQLGARHTFNAADQRVCDSSQRNANSAFEPGSGSTLMSYSGLCSGQNLQSNSDPYFHAGSIAEIRATLDSNNRQSCGIKSALDNAIPQIQLAKTSYAIPTNTAFVLNASATDDDLDPLTYSWEQVDAGGIDGGTVTSSELRSDNGQNPLFRSFPATNLTQRYFPKLSSVFSGQLSDGEVYPTTERTLTLRLTARDNRGGVNSADVKVAIVPGNQSFAFTSPSNAVTWAGLSKQTIHWQVAQTTQPPISCNKVDILLSADSDRNFDYVLASAVDNDGEQQVQLPNIASNSVRLMLKCSDNVFYSLNNADLSITLSAPIRPVITGQLALTMAEDSSRSITLDDIEVEDADSIYPDDFTLLITAGDNYSFNNNELSPILNFNGQLRVNIKVNDGQQDSEPFSLVINVSAVNDAPLAVNDSISVQQNSGASLINVLANDSDIEGDALSILGLEYTGQGKVSIISQQISYEPAAGFSGSETITYTLSDGQLTAVASLNVNVIASTSPIKNQSSGGSLSQLLIFMLFGLSIKGLVLRFKEYHE